MTLPEACTPAFLCAYCQKAGFALDTPAAQTLSGYISLLMQWNRAINLTGARHWRDALEYLIMDSFHLCRFLQESILPQISPSPICWDLGAGAGLPGIPLRMLWNSGEYWLVETKEKRAIFLSTVLARQPLKGTRVFCGRAEVFMHGRKADIILSRAFMPWAEMLNFVRGHLNIGGMVIFLSREKLLPTPNMEWKDAGFYVYSIQGDTRHICAFSELA